MGENSIDRLGFGCVALSTLASPRAARDLLQGVFELGLRHFDTAPIYGQGYSERLLGDFLRGRREQVSVATKFGMVPRRPPRLPTGIAMRLAALRRRLRRPAAAVAASASTVPSSPTVTAPSLRRIGHAEVQAAFDASRRSLGTDYIDIYLLHEELPSALEPGALDLLLELKASQRIGKLGLAAHGSRYVGLAERDLAHWDILQYEYGPAWPDHAGLPRQFPGKTHFFHSCLRGVAREGGAPGRVLAQCLAANSSGRVLFSSTKLAHVRDNLRALRA
jgi:aryl-alcohol dehydrogenase-like predicted oxidoreductase